MESFSQQIFLARHGETEGDLKGEAQGQGDSPLTKHGLQQVKLTAAMLSRYGIDAVFSSPLGRSMTTAHIIAKSVGIAVIPVDDLRGIDRGPLTGITESEFKRLYPQEFLARQSNPYFWQNPGGESIADLEQRVVSILPDILAYGANRPLIVSHRMISRVLLRNLVGLPREGYSQIQHPHDLVYRVFPQTSEFFELRANEEKRNPNPALA